MAGNAQASQLTAYPKLVAGLAFVPVRDGYVVQGGLRPELVTGRAARELFPHLLPLLDGTRSLAQVGAALGMPVPPLTRVVDQLRRGGLLQLRTARADDRSDPDGDGPLWTFLSGLAGTGRAAAVRRRLHDAQVRVAGAHPLADLLRRLLSESGVETVTRDPAGEHEQAAELVVTVARASDPVTPDATGVGSPLLPVRVAPALVRVGPFQNLPDGLCARCATEGTGREAVADRQSSGRPGADPTLAVVAAGVAAGAVLRQLTGYGTPLAADYAIEIAAPSGVPREVAIDRRPGCPECGPGVDLSGPERAELAYERSAGLPPRNWDLRPPDPAEWAPRILAKPYLTEPRAAASAGLRWLLARTVGAVRPRRTDSSPDRPRWAPSAGRPGSTHAYLIADLAGAGPRAYYFDGTSHELVLLPDQPPAGYGWDAASVVLTGELAVLASRWGPAARRGVYQDAGLAAAQLHACAEVAGFRVRARGGLETGDLSALELDPEREVTAAGFDLHPVPPTTDQPGERRRSGRLLRTPMTYRFSDRSVAASAVTGVVAEALCGVDQIWPGRSWPVTGCSLYARRVDGLSPGLHLLAAESPPVPLGREPELALVEAYLRDRDLDPAALLLFTGDLPAALSTHGPAGYPALVVRAAATAGLARLAAARAGLGVGLLARVPSALLSTVAGAGQPVVCYGCVLGRADPGVPERRVPEWVTW